MHKIAFVQGRLVDQIDNKIQAFPIDTWKDELVIAAQNDMKYIELTVDLTDIEKNPLSNEEHAQMALILKTEFNEVCYMSCARLNSTATIIQNFQHNVGKYSFEVLLRYFLIILIGFGPLFILLSNSKLKSKNLFFFKYFKNLLKPFLFILSPVIVWFAMAGDWGRIVNIVYVFSIIFFISFYKNNLILLDENKLKKNYINKLSKRIFITIFIIFCFGWNPKTLITGDVASFPGYRVPYKFFKIVSN